MTPAHCLLQKAVNVETNGVGGFDGSLDANGQQLQQAEAATKTTTNGSSANGCYSMVSAGK